MVSRHAWAWRSLWVSWLLALCSSEVGVGYAQATFSVPWRPLEEQLVEAASSALVEEAPGITQSITLADVRYLQLGLHVERVQPEVRENELRVVVHLALRGRRQVAVQSGTSLSWRDDGIGRVARVTIAAVLRFARRRGRFEVTAKFSDTLLNYDVDELRDLLGEGRARFDGDEITLYEHEARGDDGRASSVAITEAEIMVSFSDRVR